MIYRAVPKGVCSRQMDFELDGDIVKNVKIYGGCPGNGIAVAKLVEGRKVNEIYELLKDVKCGDKPTSCSAELAKAIKNAYDNNKK